MASGTQQHQHQHQQGQQQQQDLPLPQQHDNQMQFVSNQSLNTCYDSPQVQHIDTMSPIASTPMSIDQTHGHMATTSTQRQQQPNRIMDSVVSASPMDQETCNQTATEHLLQTQTQKSHLLPLLLSPQPTGHKFPDRTDQSENDHDQIIEQAISLEDEYSDPSVTMSNVDSVGMVVSNQPQHYLMSDTNLTNAQCLSDGNQLSTSAEDLLNLLSEFDRDSSTLVSGGQQLDQDEKVGIETIRKQLMSCEVQSDQLLQQNTNSMSPILNQLDRGQPTHTRTTHQSHHNLHQQQVTQQPQLISQTAPVISPHKQSHISNPGLSQQQRQPQLSHHHRLSVDQSMLQSPYSNAHLGPVPVSSPGQPYTPHQHQSVSRISQSTPMSVDNNSPSPSWQQPQLSPFSPQSTHIDLNGPPTSQLQQQHQTIQQTHLMQQQQQQQQHPTTATSPQIQQLHHPMQRISPSQSISPPATTEPSPVVKKNPLLNAQLVNSRAPSMTPSRFMNSHASVLNQNPILNSKLSQNLYVTSSCGPTSSLTQQNRFIQQQQQPQQQPHQQSNFNYDITQQQQHVSPQQGQYMSMYGHNEHPQQQQQQQQQQQHQQHTNQLFRTSTVGTTASSSIPPRWVPQMSMGSTSPSGGLSQQVKQEIRKKVQQPKQQHQTTSLLKQLLSDDNK